MAYHDTDIPKGVLGQFSKIMEEVLEMKDAIDRNAKVMVIAEMVDIIGALELYVEANYPCLTLADLVTMSQLTRQSYTGVQTEITDASNENN